MTPSSGQGFRARLTPWTGEPAPGDSVSGLRTRVRAAPTPPAGLPAAAMDPAPREVGPKPAPGACDAEVDRECQAEASANRRPLDGGYHGERGGEQPDGLTIKGAAAQKLAIRRSLTERDAGGEVP